MSFILAQGLLDVNFGLFFWVLITFLLFLFILGKFAWKPILGALDVREMNIKDSLEAAKKAMAEAEHISQQNKNAVREVEVMAQNIRKEAQQKADSLRDERLDQAKREAAKLLEQARNTIEQEKRKALVELRSEVADLAIKATTLILESEVDAPKNKKLVDKVIQDLSKTSKNEVLQDVS
ncbi:MAG: F0F1 ATP synthase subunit B [Balneolales bacterium]